MSTSITIPTWLFVLLLLITALAALSWLLIPGVRFVLRRRVNRVIEDVNTKLQIELRPFQLTQRQVLIDRLTDDPVVMEVVNSMSASSGESRDSLLARVRRYAREIVPSFNAYMYFRLGYWMARQLAHRLYRVRIAQMDNDGFANIDPEATVVFVMNHRSNMDYVLVSCLVAERTALSYAVGERARIWPLHMLVKSLGGFFVRRNSRNTLYRKVLERYVHMASREGVCQAVFLEGGLSKDGRMREPKMGFLGYMLRDFNPSTDRDVVLVPVGVNYDRTLEDRTLLRGLDAKAERRGKWFAIWTTARFVGRNLRLMLGSRWRRLGYAAAAFGTPVSVRGYLESHASVLNSDGSLNVEPIANSLVNTLQGLIPVLPVPIMAKALLNAGGTPATEEQLVANAKVMVDECEARGLVIGIPKTTRHYSLTTALEMLLIRHIVPFVDGVYSVPNESIPVLRYYANSISD